MKRVIAFDCTTLEEKHKMVKDVIRRTNKRMKRIANALNIPKPTTSVARHSYATVLKRSNQASIA